MITAYLPVLFYFVIMVGLAGVIIGLSHYLSPRAKVKSEVLLDPYECGLPSEGLLPDRYPIKFYLVAILFVLFDVEAVFIWPWAITYQSYRSEGFQLFWYTEMIVFLAILLVGYLYVVGKGAFDWK